MTAKAVVNIDTAGGRKCPNKLRCSFQLAAKSPKSLGVPKWTPVPPHAATQHFGTWTLERISYRKCCYHRHVPIPQQSHEITVTEWKPWIYEVMRSLKDKSCLGLPDAHNHL